MYSSSSNEIKDTATIPLGKLCVCLGGGCIRQLTTFLSEFHFRSKEPNPNKTSAPNYQTDSCESLQVSRTQLDIAHIIGTIKEVMTWGSKCVYKESLACLYAHRDRGRWKRGCCDAADLLPCDNTDNTTQLTTHSSHGLDRASDQSCHNIRDMWAWPTENGLEAKTQMCMVPLLYLKSPWEP